MSTQLKRLNTDPTFYVVTLGYKSTLKTLRSGKAKLVIIAGNTPPLRTFVGVHFSSFRPTLGSVDYSIDMFQHFQTPHLTDSTDSEILIQANLSWNITPCCQRPTCKE